MCINWNNNCIHSVRAIAHDHTLSTFEIAHVERVQWQSPSLPEAKEKENSDRGLPLSEDGIPGCNNVFHPLEKVKQVFVLPYLLVLSS